VTESDIAQPLSPPGAKFRDVLEKSRRPPELNPLVSRLLAARD